jgi:hypothetical protein
MHKKKLVPTKVVPLPYLIYSQVRKNVNSQLIFTFEF